MFLFGENVAIILQHKKQAISTGGAVVTCLIIKEVKNVFLICAFQWLWGPGRVLSTQQRSY